MKIKHLFPAAVLALAMTACTADELVKNPESADKPITFNAITGNNTRAMHSYDANTTPASFRVWAFVSNTGENYFASNDENYNGDVVKWDEDETKWKPEIPRTWPSYPVNGWSLNFFACADDNTYKESSYGNAYEVSYTNYTYSAILKNFKVNTEPKLQRDPLYAVSLGATANNEVQLNFLHALSQICFRAQNNDTGMDYVIQSVTFHNIDGQGDFIIPTDKSTDVSDPTYSGNDENYNYQHGWKLYKNDDERYNSDYHGSAYSVSFGEENTKGVLLKRPVSQTGSANGSIVNLSVPQHGTADTHNHSTVDDNGKEVTGKSYKYSERALNLIPQNKVAAVTKNADGTWKTEDNGTQYSYITVKFLANNELQTKHIPFYIDWYPGNRYIYTLIFSAGAEIAYNVKVANQSDNLYTPNQSEEINRQDAVLMREETSSQTALYFAKCNLGTTDPKATGNYYHWGQLTNTNNNFTEAATSIGNGSGRTKDCWDASNIANTDQNWFNKVGDNYLLAPERDAAYNTLGGYWRIPTATDWAWLTNSSNCTWTPDNDENGKLKGYTVKSVTTGGEIYLPATGIWGADDGNFSSDAKVEDKYLYSIDRCYYWTSNAASSGTINSVCYYIYEDNNSITFSTWDVFRYYGIPIRPVSY